MNSMHAQPSISSPARHASGFTLIEVLVSVLVLSIGLLGLASLQATSLRYNNDSSAQTQAAYLASDMADRMRANLSEAANYPGTPAAADLSCYSSGCSPSAMAGNDIAEWNTALDTLPAGKGTITAVAGGLYKITVMWDENRTGATGTNCDPNDKTDLRCVSITTQP